MRQVLLCEIERLAFGVVEDHVVATHEARHLSFETRSSAQIPDDFSPEPRVPEYGVHKHLEIVACGWITVQVDAACAFEPV